MQYRLAPVIICTGVRGGGKTTLCTRIAAHDAVVSHGVLSQPSFDTENRRTGILAAVFPPVRRIPLAIVVDPESAPPDGAVRMYEVAPPPEGVLRCAEGDGEACSFETATVRSEGDLFIGPYRFFVHTFETVNAIVQHEIVHGDSVSTSDAVRSGRLTHVTVIDEIGPLEITERRGFYPLLHTALADRHPLVATARGRLVDSLKQLAGSYDRRTVVFEIDGSTEITTVAEQIVTLCIQERVDE